MAKEEKVQSGGGSSGGSSSSSSGGSSSKSFSGSASKGGSSSSKSSSLGSSKVSGGKSVSSAGSNARAAIQAGRAGALASKQKQTGQTQASRYLAARANAAGANNAGSYRGALNSPTAGNRGFGASGGMQGLQEGRESQRSSTEREQSTEDSYLQASIMELARGAGGKELEGDGTAFGYANELVKRWNAGEDVVPVVKNGEVEWERGVDRTGSRVFYDFDAEGNKVKTTDKKLSDANDTAMWADVDAYLNYANSGSQTKADNVKQSARIAEYMRAIENGLMDNYDVTKNSGETVSLYDYLGELFDMRGDLDKVADQNEAATALGYFTNQFNDVYTRMENGMDVDLDKMGDDLASLQGYTSRFSKDEQLSPLFNEISNEYYRLYNRESVKNLEAQNEQLLANLQQAQNDARVASEGANWLNSADNVVSDEDRRIAEEKKAAADASTKEAYDAQQAVQAQLDQLNADYRARFMTPEVEAAMNRLSIAQLGKAYSKEDIENYLKAGNNRASFTGSFKDIAEQMRREDQALVDEWNRGLGFNEQYYNWQDRIGGIGKSFGARTLGSAANLAAWGVNATTYANDEVRQAQQAYDAASRDWLTNQTPENKAAMDAAEIALQEAQNRVATGEAERTTPAVGIEQFADKMSDIDRAEVAKAKEGLSKWGQFGVDLASTGLDMGLDALTGGGLYTMFARVAGQGIGEARRAGADSGEQLLYGLSTAAIEAFTEKLTDGVGFIYGKGISSDVVEKAISRLSTSDAGANFLRLLAGAVGEGGEEVVSDLLNPFTQWIIEENARDSRTYDVDLSELLYDFMLGGAMGLLGQGVEAVGGGYAAKNAEIKENDASILEKAENAKATGQQLTNRELADLRAAQARQENAAIAGGLQVNKNGSISPVSARSVTKGNNRHATATNVLAEGFEDKGYVNSTNEDEDYNTATTGMENRPLSEEEADQQSHDQMLEEEGKRQAEAAAEEEARKAQEEKNAENAKLDEESKRREQEIEGARQAAKAFQDEQDAQLRAAQEAEAMAQRAHAAREFQAEQDFIRQAEQARQAAEEAGRKAEEQMAIAESQSQALEAQNQNVAPAPANQEKQNQSLAASQAQTIEGQDTNPVQASKNTEVATATETAQGEEQASTQAQTPDNAQESVKLEGNAQGEGVRAAATAEQGKTSIESGETNNKTVAEVIPMVDKYVSTQDAVSTVAENVFAKSFSEKTPLSERVTKWFKSRFPSGNVKASSVGGSVVIAKRGIKNDVAHGLSDAKVATFAAIPDILDKGMVVSQSDGSAKDKSVTVAGKVMLYGEPVNVYCVVKKNSGNNRFYLHEVSDGNGTVYYQIDSDKKNATPALQDSTGTNPASADVTSKASIAQLTKSGKTTSTNTQESGTINTQTEERSTEDGTVSATGRKSGTSDSGSNGRTRDVVSRAPVFSGEHAEQHRAKWAETATAIEASGGIVLAKDELPPFLKKASEVHERIFGSPITYYDASNMSMNAQVGSAVKNVPGAGAFVAYNHPALRRLDGGIANGPGTAGFHEGTHNRWDERGEGISRKRTVLDAMYRAHITKADAKGMANYVLQKYGFKYTKQRGMEGYLGVNSNQEWANLSDEARASRLASIPVTVRNDIVEDMYEDMGNYLATNDVRYKQYQSFGNVADEMRNGLVKAGIYTQEEIDEALREAAEQDEAAMAEKEQRNEGYAEYDKLVQEAKPIDEFEPDTTLGMYSLPFLGKDKKQKKTLVAVRNMSAEHAISMLRHGGEPMPSIAIMKPSHGHEGFGEVSIIYNKDTVDPSADNRNRVYGTDAWTPTHPDVLERKRFKSNADEFYKEATDIASRMTGKSFFEKRAFNGDKKSVIDSLSKRPAVKYMVAKEAGLSNDEIWGEYLPIRDIIDALDEMSTFNENSRSIETSNGRFFIDVRVPDKNDWQDFDIDDYDPSFDDELNYKPNKHAGESAKEQLEEWGYYKPLVDKLSEWFEFYGYDDPFATLSEADGVELISKAAQFFADSSDFIDPELYLINEAIPDTVSRSFIESHVSGEEVAEEIIRDDYGKEMPYTLENALDMMLKDRPRQPIDHDNVTDIRSLVTHSFKSFKDLKSHENQLTPEKNHNLYREQYDEAKKATKAAISAIEASDRLANGKADLQRIAGLYERNVDLYNESNEEAFNIAVSSVAPQASQEAKDRIREAFEKLANLPTGYFEAKPQRVVPNSEIAAIIMPDSSSSFDGIQQYLNIPEINARDSNTLSQLRDLAQKAGIPVLEYGGFKKGIDKDKVTQLIDQLRDYDKQNKELIAKAKATQSIEERSRLKDDIFELQLEIIGIRNDLNDYVKQSLVERSSVIQNDLTQYLFEEPYLEGNAAGKATDAVSGISLPPVDSTPHTPGKESVTQSVAERQMATKGEGATTDAAMGEATYISRTNAARSETADHLTDTQEKADAQIQRLLEDGYTWTDDDVVIAQKLMFDMIKSIRDYQMHRSGKMNTAAFRTLTEQYNRLMTKHQQMLSEAGQKLQANYMFSDGDKIIMKAAQTFLGFTKDGRFAGAAPNAKNAKIYAGIEEAVKRISTAIEAKDTQGLAKICKDISDIRNVKKMFGPLGKFADEMETRVLDKVSKGENAAENLEKLAYGNLNAVCDDVQPYKALNAAKTIRVMNMLSNTATIVNNLANNFAQGAVSRSMVNQAFNQLAAKPFEALTGQKVLSTTQRGKTAQKAVHNAKVEALEAATLMQMYGISENNGRLELNDRGMFNPNINAFEQTMSLYKFLTGMGVEATDQMQAAGFLKEMELGIDEDIKAGKIAAHTREQRMQEARHEVNRLLYKDDNSTTALVQHVRDFLNKWSVGNEKTGTIGVGDITMAFAKIPANVVRARLAMTPEGALLQLAQYAKGVNKAKRMHAEVLANNIAQKYSPEMEKYRNTLNALYETEPSQERTKAIEAVKSKISAINNQMWAEAREQCRGSVFRNLETIRNNYNENMPYDEAVERAGYTNAKEMSQFEAAQLSRKIGRAAMSASMMALGSVLRALGGLRDFDQEPDDELRKMNKDKGYQGLMFNANAMFRPGHEWKDGDLVLDGEFLEVIAMPLTIGATAAEAAATAQDAKTWAWLKSMAGNGIAKTFEAVGDIPGMADAINMYESMTSAYTTDYDEKVSRLGAGLLNYAANTVPSFFMPNSVSQAAAGFDNTVRDVYTTDSPWEQAKNIFMNKFPVLRNKIPASVDVWGNERNYGEGLWGAVNKMLLPGDVRVYRKNKYEAEIERLVKEGYSNATPTTTVNSSFEIGDEKYTMTAQEKRDFKLGRNQQQKELYEAFMDSDYYDQLTDAERMKVFKALKTSAERDAKQTMLNDRQVNVQVTRDRWETELTDINDQIQFLAAKQMANDALDRDKEDMDYKAVDDYLTGAYKNLNETQRDLLDSTYSRLDDMYEAKSKYGIGSEMWQKGYDIYKDYMSDEGRARVQGGYKDWEGSQMYTDIANATGASEKQMDFFEDKFVLYNNNAVIPEKYNTFVDSGWSRDSAQSLVKAISDLEATNGRKTVSYKQRLTAIATTPILTDAQRWEAFFEYCPSSYTSVIRTMSRYKSNGTPYEKALKAARKWDE